jgi:hypothetical protein
VAIRSSFTKLASEGSPLRTLSSLVLFWFKTSSTIQLLHQKLLSQMIVRCASSKYRANSQIISPTPLGDYGAKKNVMKEGYGLRLALPISRNTACKVTIGSGKQTATVGATSICTIPVQRRG